MKYFVHFLKFLAVFAVIITVSLFALQFGAASPL